MGEQLWTCSVGEVLQATGGQAKSHVFKDFQHIGTDTRQALAGKLFVPLKGENYDAHNFVATAVEGRAHVVLVHEWRAEWQPLLARATFIQVPDTLQALQALALYWRRKHAFKVLGITGSNGKTSTKEFTYGLLKDWAATHATKGSYNNHWGLPLTILAANPSDQILILEMGMNHAGELQRLVQISEPDVVVVTTVGRAHIGELGSMANVAQAKEEIYAAAPQAVHIFNMDNEWTMHMQSRSQCKQILFSSFRKEVDVHFRAQRLSWEGLDLVGEIRGVKGQTWVHVVGRQNTVNLMAAASLALAAGMEPAVIWQQLGSLSAPAWGRNQLLLTTGGTQVLFDAYNANPDSMQALFKNIYEIDSQGVKYLVVGDMGEQGAFSDTAHEELGERAAQVGFTGIWYVGANSQPFVRGLEKIAKPKVFFTSRAPDSEIAQQFASHFKFGDFVAVKGSRSVHLEKVVESWPLQDPLGQKP
jgi:UDP-N-acetylmuramoyl-tripeptide--D-alanyl-D-alanine ligase